MEYWGPRDRGEAKCVSAIRWQETRGHMTWQLPSKTTPAVNLLLFIRHTWVIAADADLPELMPSPASVTSRVPDSASRAEWESRWRTAWERAWTWYQIADSTRPQYPTQESMRQMQETMRQVMRARPTPPPAHSAPVDHGIRLGRHRPRRVQYVGPHCPEDTDGRGTPKPSQSHPGLGIGAGHHYCAPLRRLFRQTSHPPTPGSVSRY
jgi:hypothetical protein